MNAIGSVKRWLGAVAVTLAPLLVLVLPPLVQPGQDYSTPEEQYTAFANGEFPWANLWLQITGAVLLVPAALGIAGVVFSRRRGVIVGLVGLVIGMIAAFALLLVLGLELGQAFLLSSGTDKEVVISLALAMSRWSIFVALLAIGFAGFFLALPILALALWRSRVVPVVVPALFLVPVLAGFLPLPATAANLVPSFALLLPCVWITVQLLRRPPLTSPATDALTGRAEASNEGDLSPSKP